jgi:Icc protein
VNSRQPTRVLQVTDPHLFADRSRRIYGVNTAQSLRAVLDEALGGGARPDAILVTGDIGDDLTRGAYENFREALDRRGVPVLCLPGNHDNPVLMREMLDTGGFQFCGRAQIGDWGVVMLDTHVHDDPAGELSETELERLESDLGYFKDLPVLVCLHHPPVRVGSPWLDEVGLRNPDDFLAIIDYFPKVKGVLSGHVHQALELDRNGVRMMTTPSTCAQFTPRTESCVMDMKPPGYRWLTLKPDGSIETEVKWLQNWSVSERPRDDRMGG